MMEITCVWVLRMVTKCAEDVSVLQLDEEWIVNIANSSCYLRCKLVAFHVFCVNTSF